MPKTVNIKSFLPQREIEICQRVREVRLANRWQQAQFAAELGINRARLASYEYAKAPIRYELGKKLCLRLNISERWLATGRLPKKRFTDFIYAPEASTRLDPLFSEVFDQHLKEPTKESEVKLIDLIGIERFIQERFDSSTPIYGKSGTKDLDKLYLDQISDCVRSLPNHLHEKYWMSLAQAIDDFFERYNDDILQDERLRSGMISGPSKVEAVGISEVLLDKSGTFAQNDAVKEIVSLTDLIAKLKELTNVRGRKSALANHCGISRQAVDQFLKFKAKPSAETTFKMMEWVSHQKGKK